MIITNTENCGFKVLDEISDDSHEDIMRKVFEELSDEPLAAFSGVVAEGYCQDLTMYIAKKRLGTVVKSITKVNPTSGNRIAVWVWAINWTNLNKLVRNLKY